MMVRKPTPLTCVSSVTTKGWRHRAKCRLKSGSGRQWLNRRRTVANCGKCWERTSLHKECGSISLLKERSDKVSKGCWEGKAGRDKRPMATRVSCQWITGSSTKLCGHRLHPEQWDLDTVRWNTEVGFERIREEFEKVAEDEAGKFEHRTSNYVEESRFPAAYHRVSRSDVVSVPHLQQFSLEDYMWWVSARKKHCIGWCAICGEYGWRAPQQVTGWQCQLSKLLANPAEKWR